VTSSANSSGFAFIFLPDFRVTSVSSTLVTEGRGLVGNLTSSATSCFGLSFSTDFKVTSVFSTSATEDLRVGLRMTSSGTSILTS